MALKRHNNNIFAFAPQKYFKVQGYSMENVYALFDVNITGIRIWDGKRYDKNRSVIVVKITWFLNIILDLFIIEVFD